MSTATTAPPVTGATTTGALPETANEQRRRAQLRRGRRRATGLLVVGRPRLRSASSSGAATPPGSATPRPCVEAAMVGGLADWFAVTALFRHPLGIPIPHTAIIPERKDQFGETLGDFVQDSFLTPEAIVERVRGGRGRCPGLAAWLAEPDNAARAGRPRWPTPRSPSPTCCATTTSTAPSRTRSAPAHRRRPRWRRWPGRALRVVTDGRPPPRAARRDAAGGRPLPRRQPGRACGTGSRTESPWWLPEARRGPHLRAAPRRRPQRARARWPDDPHHELRRDFDDRVPALRRRAADVARAAGAGRGAQARAAGPTRAAASGSATVWRDIKATLRAQADDPDSRAAAPAGRRLVAFGAPAAGRPGAGGPRRGRASRAACATWPSTSTTRSPAWSAARSPGGTADETADRLELLLGPDLQFIRINGTVVGGLAGLLIHAVGQAF